MSILDVIFGITFPTIGITLAIIAIIKSNKEIKKLESKLKEIRKS